MRAYAICLFIILLVCQGSYGQLIPANPIVVTGLATYPAITDSTAKKFTNLANKAVLQSVRPLLVPVAADHYVRQLGFFCVKELQMEKTLKMPLRLRLGSVDYCDRLEGKKRF